MDCEILPVEPRSDEWDALRRCRITASRLGDVMSTPKKCKACKGSKKVDNEKCQNCDGKGEIPTKRYLKYQQQMVLELAGAVYVDDEAPWFEHGKRMEPRAIGAASWRYGWKIDTAVFLIHHKYDWFGCSPDGLINNHTEGAEFKCRSIYQQYLRAREDGIEQAHRFQVQGAMWMTGLDSWWYLNYYENEKDGTRKLHRILVPRNDELISKMEKRCKEFMDECWKLAGMK